MTEVCFAVTLIEFILIRSSHTHTLTAAVLCLCKVTFLARSVSVVPASTAIAPPSHFSIQHHEQALYLFFTPLYTAYS